MVNDNFPNNTEYVLGECYLRWSSESPATSRFTTECDTIANELIASASPSTNELTLVDGSVIKGVAFIVRPLDAEGNPKMYGIGSAMQEGSATINIINYQVKDTAEEKSPFAEALADPTVEADATPTKSTRPVKK